MMLDKIWWDYFDEDPYEKVGRFVPDSFGSPIVVELARISWAYLDWVTDVQGGDYAEFFRDNDRVRHSAKETIHEKMESAVRTLYLRRERAGSPRPEWCPPTHPDDLIDV